MSDSSGYGNKAVIQAGWKHAPWLSEETKKELRESTPAHLREAREEGLPALGAGNVFPIPLEMITCQPFKLSKNFRFMYALDVGWNKTAALWAAVSDLDDTVYLWSEHYVGGAPPAVHAAAIKDRERILGFPVPGVIDPAAHGRSPHDGLKLIRTYRELGLRLKEAKNEVESGIANCFHRLSSGRIKAFNTLPNFQGEYMIYRRDLNGRIVKEKDHLMDCMRYIINNIGLATYPPSTTSVDSNSKHGGIDYGI